MSRNTTKFSASMASRSQGSSTCMEPARLCAKDVYALLEQLRANARENQAELKAWAGDGNGGRRDGAWRWGELWQPNCYRLS